MTSPRSRAHERRKRGDASPAADTHAGAYHGRYCATPVGARLQRLVHGTLVTRSAQSEPRAIARRWTGAKRGHILSHRSSAAWFAARASTANGALLASNGKTWGGPLCAGERGCTWRPEGSVAGRRLVSCSNRKTTTPELAGRLHCGPCTRHTTMHRSLMVHRPGCPDREHASDSNGWRIDYARSDCTPGPPLESGNYLMLQPGSHYPKVC